MTANLFNIQNALLKLSVLTIENEIHFTPVNVFCFSSNCKLKSN